MSKRKLTRQQAWRVEKIQEERRQRAQRKGVELDALDSDQIGPEQTGLVIANYGASVDIEGVDGTLSRCRLRQNLELPVPGDTVIWQALTEQDSGVVVAINPRRSVLARPDARGELKPLAANLDQILVVAAPRPAYSTDLIDQYLVAAETTGLKPLLVFNKVDLLEGDSARHQVERDLARYQTIGYPIIRASTVAQHGLDALRAALAGKVSVFVGQSGVGKSSLVQTLLPASSIRVGALMESSGLGRHTTSTARYYRLPGGGAIIDSPGVREFALWPMTRTALAHGYVEFQPLLGQCRFRDCRHLEEPGCALHQALEEGRISAERLASFHRLAAAQDRGD